MVCPISWRKRAYCLLQYLVEFFPSLHEPFHTWESCSLEIGCDHIGSWMLSLARPRGMRSMGTRSLRDQLGGRACIVLFANLSIVLSYMILQADFRFLSAHRSAQSIGKGTFHSSDAFTSSDLLNLISSLPQPMEQRVSSQAL